MPIFRRNLAALFLVFLLPSASALAQEPLFLDQKKIESSSVTEQLLPLTLGRLKKIDGSWIAEREEMLQGSGTSITYELSASHYTMNSAWADVQAYYASQNATLIHECLNFDCGSSNAWANERFKVKQLYGSDSAQRYQVWQLNEPRSFVSVYLVQRGNKRIYAHIEKLVPTDASVRVAPSAAVYSRRLYSTERLVLSDITFANGLPSFDREQLEQIARALNEQPFRRLVITGRVAPTDSTALAGRGDAAELGKAMAAALEQALIREGVQKRRIDTEGGAPLSANDAPAQLEIKLQ